MGVNTISQKQVKARDEFENENGEHVIALKSHNPTAVISRYDALSRDHNIERHVLPSFDINKLIQEIVSDNDENDDDDNSDDSDEQNEMRIRKRVISSSSLAAQVVAVPPSDTNTNARPRHLMLQSVLYDTSEDESEGNVEDYDFNDLLRDTSDDDDDDDEEDETEAFQL